MPPFRAKECRVGKCRGYLQGRGVSLRGQADSALPGQQIPRSFRHPVGSRKWAIGFAGSEGFATGLGGTATMVADVGAVIVLAFRTIHKIAMCYGYEVKSAEDKEFVLNILSVSGANDMKEKKEALLALKSDFLQKKIIEEVLMSNLVKKVAKQLGINLTKRKLMQIMPIIGAGIGAAVNASYINDIAWTARRSYQLKWLADNEYIDANNLNNI